MKLTTTQAAEKLGVTTSTVIDLIQRKLLTDTKPRKDGAKKHYAQIDSKELSEFAKTYRKKSRANGTSTIEAKPQATKPAGGPAGLLTRLERIETKLDQLLKVWQ